MFNKFENILIYVIIFIMMYYVILEKSKINIYIGNSFKNYYHLPSQSLNCKKRIVRYKCNFLNTNNTIYHASIYNGNRKFPLKPNFSYNIVITTEKLSQVKFMKDIGDGKYRNYHLAVDYRLFNSKYHISRSIYSYFDMSKFIQTSRNNFGNISSFLKRKNYVYIQRVHYKNRQFLVKEMMKYLSIDSFGNDLNNKKWPYNIHTKIDLLKEYKFCIAIENSVITWKNGTKFEANIINNDYVTEKLIDCLLAGSIPIYFGPKNVNLFLPHPNAIINFSSFDSIKDLTNYIKEIIYNSSLLKKHLQWYNNNISKKWFNRFSFKYTFSFCKICNSVKQYYNSRK